MSKDKVVRCAIYTRKSTEEGLDQEFNSLAAQREAAEAYIKSQQHEGWQVIDKNYDDGGFSGGNTERPGLKLLMTDIEAGKVDMVVVYKVDRLSRSLHDFAKMVDVFDRRGISFVSVTQQFNTSTSMGRLTLNVLLSFAQFEREVTAERIRDKIGASKRKGMWMGGRVPFGYDVIDRKLVVNSAEADQLCTIFRIYLKLRSVDALMDYLERKNITHKITREGTSIARKPFTRSTLYNVLRHPAYIGKLAYQGIVYDAQHDAILDKDIWQQVQDLLDSQARSTNGHYGKSRGMLQGKLCDVTGKCYWSTAAEREKGKQHRYYYQKRTRHRIAARDIEPLIIASLHQPDVMAALKLNEEQQYQWELRLVHEPHFLIQRCVKRIVLGEHSTRIVLVELAVSDSLAEVFSPKVRITKPIYYEAFPDFTVSEDSQSLEIELQHTFIQKAKSVAIRGKQNAALLKAIGSAYRWECMLSDKPSLQQKQLAEQENVDCRYLKRALNLRYLAPDIMTSILNGTQPDHLTLDFLKAINLPVCWKAQRKILRIT